MELPTLFFDRHPNPMLIFDLDTLEILEVNKRAEQKYGYTRDEFRKMTIEDIRPPEAIPQMHERLKAVKDQTQIFDVGTVRHQTKEGDIIYVQITGQNFPMENKSARIVHIHDVTETIRLKQEVEEVYYEQQQHIENNPLGMVKYDKNFIITEWSHRAVDKTGYTKDEVVGKSLFEMDLLSGEYAEEVKERLQNIPSGKIDKDRFETVIEIKDGSRMDVRIHASALYDKEDNLESVLAFIENITERKEYERELEKRETKFRTLFEEANDGIFLMDGLQFIDCNERITKMFGAAKEDIIGKSPLDFSPETQPNGRASVEIAKEKMELAQKGKPQVFEWKHETLEGELIDTEVSLNKLELAEKTYIQAILRDLTEHKEIKNQLEAEQQRLKKAQKLARIGWWSYEAKENRVIWSDVLFDILGVDKQNFQGTFEDFYELVHPDDRAKLAGVMERAEQSEKNLNYVLRLQSQKTDEIIHARCRAKSELDEHGKLDRLSGVLQDVTDQKKAQDELKRRKELFESLFLDSPVAIVMIDTEGTIQKLNKSFEELFGYSEEELIGKDLLKHQLPEERYDETEEIYKNVFSNEGTSKYYEDQRITKDGEEKDLLVGALPVMVEGEPIAAFGIYTDITKLRKTERNLKDSLKEKEILLSEIHHRVKNNLAVISGLLLLESMNWEEESTVYKVLMQSKLRIHSMAKIHEKLYDSKDFANLNLENYVSELVDTISQTMNVEEHRININIECDDILLNINQALPSALIINELVTNSFKYAFDRDQNNELEVKLLEDNNTIHVLIADNGPGLPADFKTMADTSLGHQLVRQLVKQLDGDINVISEENKGTRYEITFEKAQKSGAGSNYFV